MVQGGSRSTRARRDTLGGERMECSKRIEYKCTQNARGSSSRERESEGEIWRRRERGGERGREEDRGRVREDQKADLR